MGTWEESPFARSGAELNMLEALRAIERVLRDGQFEARTRWALEAARQALQREIG